MKEYPIIFSPEMVKAILEGRKTMTRRIITQIGNTQPTWNELAVVNNKLMRKGGVTSTWYETGIKCPYGVPDDELWVRENWTQNGLNYYRYQADWLDTKPGESNGTFTNPSVPEKFRGKWKPSIHMPRVAARILLRVTDVKVERLQDISNADAKLEGVEMYSHGVYKNYAPKPHGGRKKVVRLTNDLYLPSASRSFQSLWYAIHGADEWNSNPWVWVVAFEVIK